MSWDALIEEGAEGATLCAPHVGRFYASVRVGDAVAGAQVLGELRVGAVRHVVRAPAAASGVVAEVVARTRGGSVGYGAPLLRLHVRDDDGAIAAAQDEAASGEAFIAPMDGQYYRRPSPEEPAFVESGDVVSPGQQVGLIEVMKFFYPIAYEGSAPARVVAVTREDGPVESGDVLLRLEPA